MKLVIFLILGMLTFFGCSSQKITPNNQKAYEIVSYFHMPDHAYNKFEEFSNSVNEPEIRSVLERSLKYFNKKEYGENVATLLTSKLSNSEINYITSYIESPQGNATKELFKNVTNPILLNALFESLSIENKESVNAFLKNTSTLKIFTFLKSPELSEINKSYGELIACRYISENKKSEYEALKSKGKCQS